MNFDKANALMQGGQMLFTNLVQGIQGYDTKEQAATSAISGALQGASAGSAFGPYGAIAGGALGFASSAFSNGKVVGRGFTDAGTLKKGGLLGHTPYKSYRDSQNAAWGNKTAMQAGQVAEQEYADNMDNINVLGRAYGGDIPYHPIKLSKGEVYVDKEGNATRIGKAKPNGKDDVLALAKGGYVFSHSPKMKDKTTGETPADEAARMLNMKKIKNIDRFSQGTKDAQNLVTNILKQKQEAKRVQTSVNKFSNGGEDSEKIGMKALYAPFVDEKTRVELDKAVDSYGTEPKATKSFGDIAPLSSIYTTSSYPGVGSDGKIIPLNLSVPKNNGGNRSNILGIMGNIGNIVSDITPTMMQLFAKPEQIQQVDNPYSGQVLSTLRGRNSNKYLSNTRAALERQQAITNYNTRNLGNLGYTSRLQTATNYNNLLNEAYARAAEMDNNYALQYATALDNAGKQWQASKLAQLETNAKNRAAAANARNTSLQDLVSYMQGMRSDKRKMNTIMPMLKDLFTTKQLESIWN